MLDCKNPLGTACCHLQVKVAAQCLRERLTRTKINLGAAFTSLGELRAAAAGELRTLNKMNVLLPGLWHLFQLKQNLFVLSTKKLFPTM